MAWKEFHLVAEPVVRELAPGMKAHLWGYNGQSPGPTIEAVEGDKVRIFVTNKLPEHTSDPLARHAPAERHGRRRAASRSRTSSPARPSSMSSMPAQSGTFMYHPHADEMVQMAMGMMGFFVVASARDPAVHARRPRLRVPAGNAYDIEPGSATCRRSTTMLDFNLWTWNSRVFPGHRPPGRAARATSVRIRFGNLTMTNHPDPPARPRVRGDLHRRRMDAPESRAGRK